MDRVNAICRHPEYISKMNTIRKAEIERIYCRHDTEHLLDVARLMYIHALETGAVLEDGESRISKETIYAAALLHDIGRADQYENGTPHDEAGAKTAERILKECGFDRDEIDLISGAILGHRHEGRAPEKDGASRILFEEMLKEADKKSRLCFKCPAIDTCKWPCEKKNMEIEV